MQCLENNEHNLKNLNVSFPRHTASLVRNPFAKII